MLCLIDSAFIINGPGFEDSKDEFVTVPKVLDEFIDFRARHLAENALREGKLSSIEPKKKSVDKARKSSLSARLSETDLDLCALALEFKAEKKDFVVFTDDYSVQNFLSASKIKFIPVLMQGIQRNAKFVKKCMQCGKKFPQSFKSNECDVCSGWIKSRMVFRKK